MPARESTAPDDPALGHNKPVLTVSELSHSLKRTVEQSFGEVRVRGEISQPKVVGSGHCYLRLKDADAVLDAVIWRGALGRLALKPEDGLEVIATGKLTTYPGKSSYQIIVEQLELAGQGALLKLLEERKKRLAAEGLFDPARKKKLPYLPEVIGVVTSPTGAVIRDILHRLADRFPRRVLVWPVRVQGEGAAAEIAAAIAGFNALAVGGAIPRPDLLIVARGGGSLEDLMPFNEENVVRAAAASAIPLIAAVGHETDTTLIDFAADHRAPTPTAAAERAVPVRDELLAQVLDDGRRLLAGMARMLAERRTRLDGLARGLGDPDRMLAEKTQRLDDREERLALAGRALVERRAERLARVGAGLRHPREIVTLAGRDLEGLSRRLQLAQRQRLKDLESRLAGAATLLASYSFERTLERGFALVTRAAGSLVARAAEVGAGDALKLRFADGTVDAVAGSDAAAPAAAKTRPKPKPSPPQQGKLL